MRGDMHGTRWRSLRLLDSEGLWAGPWVVLPAADDIPILFAHHVTDGTVVPMTAIAVLLPSMESR